MENQILIIAGSARKEGATMDFIQMVFAETAYTVIELSTLQVANYCYDGMYPDEDDFLTIVQRMINSQVIVFATPVYWYAMSGLMKVLFDRFTDIVTTQKQLGRALKGKSIFLLSVGTDAQLPEGFEVPFAATAQYLQMNYKGSLYQSTKHPKATAVSIAEKNLFMTAIEIANG